MVRGLSHVRVSYLAVGVRSLIIPLVSIETT
jgi:hypothetical protein